MTADHAGQTGVTARLYVGPPMDGPPTRADLQRMQLLDVTDLRPLAHRRVRPDESRAAMERVRAEVAAKEAEHRRFADLFRRPGGAR